MFRATKSNAASFLTSEVAACAIRELLGGQLDIVVHDEIP